MTILKEIRVLPLVLVPQYFGSIIYDYRTFQYMPFDRETTLQFIQLKDRPINEILDEIADQLKPLLTNNPPIEMGIAFEYPSWDRLQTLFNPL